eukprot:1158353-Pelagomonas_calceolata.AAC.4
MRAQEQSADLHFLTQKCRYGKGCSHGRNAVVCVQAETTRLLLTMGGMPFEDATFGFDKWGELKASMPYGQVPVLEGVNCPFKGGCQGGP